MAIIAMTIKIPTPIPAWKMSPMTSQLENVVNMRKNTANLKVMVFMIPDFYSYFLFL